MSDVPRKVSAEKKVQAVVDRMRIFFIGTGMKYASREMVEKWAREIEEIIKGSSAAPH
jgi:hypothetical protein